MSSCLRQLRRQAATRSGSPAGGAGCPPRISSLILGATAALALVLILVRGLGALLGQP